VKILLFVFVLICTSQIAAAQQTVVRYGKHPKAERAAARAAPLIAVPQQVAPPQEVFASQPEKETETPLAPSDCDLRLTKIAVFRQLATIIAPGECGAADAVLLESVILPDQGKVAIAPATTLRRRPRSSARRCANWKTWVPMSAAAVTGSAARP
jgi:hypothetical protein